MSVAADSTSFFSSVTVYLLACVSLFSFWIKHYLFIWLHNVLSKVEHLFNWGPQCSSSGRAFIFLSKFTEIIGAKPYITDADINMKAPSTHFDKMLVLRTKLIKLFDKNLKLLYPTQSFKPEELNIEQVKLFDNFDDERSYYITANNNNNKSGIKGTVLYFHGGGFMCGESTTYANILSSWLFEHNYDCLVVDYGLCPYYSPEEIAIQGRVAYNYLIRERNIDPKKLVVAGESAGANLSIQVVRELVNEGNFNHVPSGVVLLSPWVDLTLSTNSWKNSGPDIVLTDNMCRLGDKLEIFDQEQSRQFSPIHMDLTHFPPCFVSWGAEERLNDEANMLCERLIGCGVKVTQDVHNGMFHAFSLFHKYIEEGKLSFDRAAAFIRKSIR